MKDPSYQRTGIFQQFYRIRPLLFFVEPYFLFFPDKKRNKKIKATNKKAEIFIRGHTQPSFTN